MAYFDKGFLTFLSELAENNNREWFHANKKRYNEKVKVPFENFVAAMIDRLSHDDPSLEPLTTKECIFRIYRDTRFSKDKTPYKTQVSAIIGEGGRKNMTKPGMYIQISHEDVRVYSGMYRLDKDQLTKVRNYIAKNLGTFRQLYEDVDFTKNFREIRGEKNKRLTGYIKEAAVQEPLLFNKQFYYFTQWANEICLKDNLINLILERYQTCRAISSFFTEALEN